MKELSFDQMEGLSGARAECFYAALGIGLAAFGGPLAPAGVVIAVGSANGCGKTLDKTFGCLGGCSGHMAKNPNVSNISPNVLNSSPTFKGNTTLQR